MTKAKKVEPPVDMDAHNAALAEAGEEIEQVDPSPVAVLTTAEVAERLETTPRTLRKFLRSKQSGVEPVGQGKRYALTEGSVPKLAKKFDAWKSKDEAERKAKATKVVESDEITDEVEEIEEIEEGPEVETTADELEALTIAKLREIAAGRGIDAPKKAKKAELIELLMDHES